MTLSRAHTSATAADLIKFIQFLLLNRRPVKQRGRLIPGDTDVTGYDSILQSIMLTRTLNPYPKLTVTPTLK